MFKKLFTAARGHANEMAEDIVDANALTILDQEIRDADKALVKSKSSLAELMGKRKIQQDKVDAIKKKMTQYETQAMQLDDESELFGDVCERMATLEDELAPLKEIIAQFESSEESLKSSVKKAEANIKMLKGQVDIVRATADAQKAQASVTQYAGNTTSLSEARGSLERIKEKQAANKARMDAAQEVATTGGDDLDARLAEAAGSSGANDMKARMLAKKAKKKK